MEHSLLLGSLALGVLGWLAGVLASRGARPSQAGLGGRAFVIGFAVMVAVAVKTVAARALWPAAYPWDLGVVLGGVAALLGARTLDRLPQVAAGPARAAVVAAPMFLVVAATATTTLWLRAGYVETLLGVAFGWFAIALLLFAGTLTAPQADTDGAVAALLPNLGFALTVPTAIALSAFRDAAAQATAWSLSASVLAVGVPLCLALVGGATLGRNRHGGLRTAGDTVATVSAAVVLGGIAALIGLRVLGQPRFPIAAAVGLAASMIVWWLCAETAGEPSREADDGLPSGPHVVGVLAVLGGIIAAFYLLIGYGVGIAMLAAWLPVSVAVAAGPGDRGGASQAVIRASLLLTLGLLVLVYRVVVQRFDADLVGASLTDHFAIFTFLAGLFVPGLLVRLLRQPNGAWRALFGIAAVFALMALVPAAALALWGARAAIGLLAGFAASTVLYPAAPATATVAAGGALLLAQWGHHAMAVMSLTRDERIRVVATLAVAAVIVLAIAEARARPPRRRAGDPLAAGTLT